MVTLGNHNRGGYTVRVPKSPAKSPIKPAPIADPVVKKRRKFSAPVIIFAIGIGLIAIGGIYFLVTTIFFPPPIIAQTVTGQQILIPAGWEMYTNKTLGFSIAHPSYYKSKEAVATLPTAAQSLASRAVSSVDFERNRTKSSAEFAPLGVNVTNQTLDQAVTYAKSNISGYTSKKYKINITLDQSLMVDGYKAVRIDVHMVDYADKGQLKEPDSDFTNVYVSANGLVYNIATQLTAAKAFDAPDAQTMYKSFTIANKK
ncbi:MAG: hypothetical protein JWO07_560 [Candidatus Saccharibacteria bacterium]|nr:hypothetical protein [Candidatus Saccharibacteria bacterium]